jgi:2-methylcitrate dehydratase
MYPEFLPVKITVETDKQTYTEELDVPKGHHRKPYSWDDLIIKGKKVMSERSAMEIANIAKRFDRSDMAELLEVVRNVRDERQH